MNDRRKQLIEQYKQMKPDMGIFIVRCKANGKCFLETSQHLVGMINRTTFQLENGAHRYQELQREWKQLGKDQFTIEVLETLKYDNDESKVDYSEELDILRMVWEEKLAESGAVFYQRK